MHNRTHIPHHAPGFFRLIEGRISLVAISAFILLSATVGLAAAVLPGARAPSASPAVLAAESELRLTLNERMHLHIKRLNTNR